MNGTLKATDSAGRALSFRITRQPTQGTLTLEAPASGKFVYLSRADASGDDSFEFDVDNGVAVSRSAQVTISLVATPVVSRDDFYSNLLEGGTLEASTTTGVLHNDQGIGDTPLHAQIVTPPQYAASFTLHDDGSFTYQHDGSEHHQDQFTYRASDTAGASATAVANLTITPVNDAPQAGNDGGSVDEGKTVTVDVLGNDSDAESSLRAADVQISSEQNGHAFYEQASNSIRFTHDGSETLQAGFTYRVADADGALSNTAQVSLQVNPINDPPLAGNDTADVGNLLIKKFIAVLGNDSDAEGGALKVTAINPGTIKGKVSIATGGGGVDYTPPAIVNGDVGAFVGNETFSYTVSDPQGASATGSVSLNLVTEKMNVILVLADDLGYGDVGAYGSKTISTPSLDGMAQDGVQFNDFYATPSCGPDRAMLMTGSYPARNQINYVPLPNYVNGINSAVITLPEFMKQQGYTTGIVGKWHLGDHPEFLPSKHGFDQFYGLPYSGDIWPFHPGICQGVNKDQRWTDANTRALSTGWSVVNPCWQPAFFPDLPLYEGDTVVDINPDQSTFLQRFVQRGKDFITANQSKPFFLYLAPPEPHVPVFPGAAYSNRRTVTAADGSVVEDRYREVVEELDAGMGEIFNHLKQLGLDERTLVIFTSDNGPWLDYGVDGGDTNPWNTLNGKTTVYEGGVRVPTLMRWPGHIPTNVKRGELAAHFDIYTTLAGMLKAPLPNGMIFDGKNLWPQMANQAGAVTPHSVIYHYNESKPNIADQTVKLQAIRDGNWKLHVTVNTTTLAITAKALYDLNTDPQELTDVKASNATQVNNMIASATSFNSGVRSSTKALGSATTQINGLISSVTSHLLTASNLLPNFDLTAEGSVDWMHWGLNGAASVDRKSGGSALQMQVIGGETPAAWSAATANRSAYSWSNGSPTASSSNKATGLYVQSTGNGFRITAPADTTVRNLRLYVGAYQARGKMTIRLSDNSAPPRYSFTQASGTTALDNTVLIQYQAGSASNQLVVEYVMEQPQTGGNITLQAATLQ